MSHGLKEGNGTAGRKERSGKRPSKGAQVAQIAPALLQPAAAFHATEPPAAEAAASATRVDPYCVDYILSMTREMKSLARKAGLMRVALILEMAELEALDQRGNAPSQV